MPPVVVDVHVPVAEKGIVHQQRGTHVVTAVDVAHHGQPLGEDEVGETGAGGLTLTVHGDVAAIGNHQRGERGEMEEPFVVQHEIVAVAAADAQMADVDAVVFLVFRLVTVTLHAAADIGETDEPRTGGTTLDIVLREGCRKGEAPAVEGIVTVGTEHLHIDTSL